MYGNNTLGDSYDAIMINIHGANYEQLDASSYRRVRLERNNIVNYIPGQTYTGGTVVIHNGKGYILKADSSSAVPDPEDFPWWKFAERTQTYTSSTNSMTFVGFSLISGVNPTVTVVTNYELGAIRVSSAPSAALTITM